MKNVAILALMALIFSSCFPFDKHPEIKIRFDKTIAEEASKLFLTDSTGTIVDSKGIVVEKGQLNYRMEISDYKTKIGIVLKFTNSGQPDYHLLLTSSFAIELKKVNGQIIAEPIVNSKFSRFILIGLIAFIAILLTRIPAALLIIWPGQKLRFMGRWIVVSLIYITAFILLFGFIDKLDAKFLVFFYLFILISDYMLLRHWYKTELHIVRILAAAFVSNLIFITGGHYIVTIGLMYLI